MTKQQDRAARAMLSALKMAADAMQDALNGGEYWRDNMAGHDIAVVRAAIRQATLQFPPK